jgi:hypothetical protein
MKRDEGNSPQAERIRNDENERFDQPFYGAQDKAQYKADGTSFTSFNYPPGGGGLPGL